MAKTMAERLAAPVKAGRAAQKKLSAQEWTFVQEYVTGAGTVSAKEAAIRAGYRESYAKEASRRLTDPMVSPHVVAAIQEVRAEMAEKYGTSYERHMRDLQLIRDRALAAGAYGAAVQAEFRRGQALGTIYIDRKEIRHGTIDSMSREEVMRKLEEIRKIYGDRGGPVIDITPEQVEESLPHELEHEPELPVEDAVLSEEEPDDADDQARVEDVPKASGGPKRGRPKLPFVPNRE